MLLAVAFLAFALVSNLTYFQKAPGGDAGVGYALSIFMGIGVFSVCLVITAFMIGSKGGFQWVATTSGVRTMLLVLSGLSILAGNAFYMLHEYPADVLPILRPFALVMGILSPLCLLIGLGVLHNFETSNLPSLSYKIPMMGVFFTSIIALCIGFARSVQNSANILEAHDERSSKIHQDHLNQIDTTDLKDIVFLLVLTDANHDIEVRSRSVAKVKSRPDWEEELIRRLQNDWAPQAFNFLASNDVDHPEKFIEPIKAGVFIQAELVRKSIQACRGDYDMYPELFDWEVDRVLRTVTKYGRMGGDYQAAVQSLRAALDEPTDFKKPKLKAMSKLDTWLNEQRKS
jgi:hypothetical protein